MYDAVIIGAGLGGIYSAYELIRQDPRCRIAVFEAEQKRENTPLTARAPSAVQDR